MAVVEMKKGFHAWLFGKDCFMETDQVKRSKKLARAFLDGIQMKRGTSYEVFDGDIEYVFSVMRPATLEVVKGAHGHWISIYGDMWGGCGTDSLPMEVNPYDYIIFIGRKD